MKTRLILFASFSVVFAALSLNAENRNTPEFLSPNDLRVENLLSDPPKKGSPGDKADYKILHQKQKDRSNLDCEKAKLVEEPSLGNLFGPPSGPLTPAEVTALLPLFDKVREDEFFAVHEGKLRWSKPRPYEQDKTIKPCVSLEKGSFAYPSGHGAISALWGDMLKNLFPRRDSDIEKRALFIGDSRVLGGVHHPSDVEAGRKLGHEIYQLLLRNKDFQIELEKVRSVVREK